MVIRSSVLWRCHCGIWPRTERFWRAAQRYRRLRDSDWRCVQLSAEGGSLYCCHRTVDNFNRGGKPQQCGVSLDKALSGWAIALPAV